MDYLGSLPKGLSESTHAHRQPSEGDPMHPNESLARQEIEFIAAGNTASIPSSIRPTLSGMRLGTRAFQSDDCGAQSDHDRNSGGHPHSGRLAG